MYTVTNIQFFDLTRQEADSSGDPVDVVKYSASITINDEFIVQVSGDLEHAQALSIPHPGLGQFAADEKKQMEAYDNIDPDDVEKEIEQAGFENNFHWLSENADEVA